MQVAAQPSTTRIAFQTAVSELKAELTARFAACDADEAEACVLDSVLLGVLGRCVQFRESASAADPALDALLRERDAAFSERDAEAEALTQTLTAARAEADAAQAAHSEMLAARRSHVSELDATAEGAACASEGGLAHDLGSVEVRLEQNVAEILDLCSEWDARGTDA